jgi:hypothetical protein
VTLLDGEDAQIHSADKFPMSRGNSCPRFCHGYGADTRFGLRSRRLAPRSCVYCKQSTANKSTANKSTANNPMQTIQCKQSNCHPERSEGSRFLRRGLDYVREFSPHTLTDGSPCVQKPTNRGCPRKLGYVPSVSRFPVPGFKLSSPSAAEGSRLSSRAQPRDLGFFGAASTTLVNSHRTPRPTVPHARKKKRIRGCPRKLEYVPSVPRFPVPGFKLSSRAQRGIPVSSALLRLR